MDPEEEERKKKELQKELLFERRVLFACTCMVGLAAVLWVAAISTNYWFVVDGGAKGIYVNATRRFFLMSHSGLWRICRKSMFLGVPAPGRQPVDSSTVTVIGNVTLHTNCKNHEMFPTDQKLKMDPSLDKTILNYSRTEVSFAIISLLLMFMGLIFSVYTFRNPRYMFKRLAGGIHFLACASVLAVIEVLINSVDYERKNLPFVFPAGATHRWGYSIVLAWLVFILLLVAGAAFMLFSRKRKGSRAPTEEIAMADEPTIIGR
ncbi:uncharacterized protein LOC134531648 [Bacillus rossius redtenbacheri]|uniref:uncharacterized protein LOC134531648 n=1 Tax=Bacillus rossius redtenbacheri TaxID=93214 RepID=UPI002FDD2182